MINRSTFNRVPLLARLLILFALQAGILGWMIWDRVQILEDGTVVRLEVEPVDPRDIFRGYYVTLNYGISRITPELLGSDENFEKHQTVFVYLTKGDAGRWQASSISSEYRTPTNGTVVIAGRIRRIDQSRPVTGDDNVERCATRCQVLTIRYGIEQYFTQQDAAKELENARQDGKVEILAAVDAGGNSAIKGIIVDGLIRYEEPPL